MKKKFLYEADILIPSVPDMSKWSVIACDQYTSEPEYWKKLYETVGDAPSTLKLILPEIFLSESKKRIPEINAEMETYKNSVLHTYKDAMVYVERTLPSGLCRRGIVAAIDLCKYDFKTHSSAEIRATEGTVLERIPPRVAIRQDATLEFPHIMLFVDDAQKSVIEPLALDALAGGLEKIYDFDLCAGGGSIRGFLITGALQNKINAAISSLYKGEGDMVFAVGDGNHSLATAKTCFENLKEQIGEEAAMRHPARFALCEVVNIHDECIVFEPIYRVIFGADPEKLISDFCSLGAQSSLTPSGKGCEFEIISGGRSVFVSFENGEGKLPVAILQEFLDAQKAQFPDIEVDYIHGENSLRALSESEDSVGFLFSGIDKSVLFSSISENGSLPRKAFSMGTADEKRFYLEGRAIK